MATFSGTSRRPACDRPSPLAVATSQIAALGLFASLLDDGAGSAPPPAPHRHPPAQHVDARLRELAWAGLLSGLLWINGRTGVVGGHLVGSGLVGLALFLSLASRFVTRGHRQAGED